MSVIVMPDDLYITRMSWNQQRMAVTFKSPFGSQTVEASPPMWAVTLEMDRWSEDETGNWKALLMKLRGTTHQLAVWDVARPQPRGTMRGTMQLGAAAAQGASVLTIDTDASQSGRTLLAGDWLGVGSGLTQQVVMVVGVSATANASGRIVVTVEPPLRNAFTQGSAVTWDKPKALFRMQSNKPGWSYETVFASGFSIELMEDVRP